MSDWTLDDALDDTPWTDDPIAHITPTEPPEQPNTPLYTPGSPQHRAHLGALIHDALQQMPRVPLPTPKHINTAYHTYRIIAARNYAAQAYNTTTLKALGEHIHDVGHIQGARFYDKNFDEIPAQGLMQIVPGTFGAQRPDEPTELEKRENLLAHLAYEEAKTTHTATFGDPDATTRDKLQATLELKMAQTHITEQRRHRLT